MEITIIDLDKRVKRLEAWLKAFIVGIGLIFIICGCLTLSTLSLVGSSESHTQPQVAMTQFVYTVESVLTSMPTTTPVPTLIRPPTNVPLIAGMTAITAKHMTQTVEALEIFPTVIATESTTGLTMSQLNAIEQAQSYLHIMAFSRSGLIDQLVFEKYSATDATFAVDSLNVDWTEQAYLKAKSYLDSMSFSLEGLIGQLEYEGFTTEQATIGATRAYSE